MWVCVGGGGGVMPAATLNRNNVFHIQRKRYETSDVFPKCIREKFEVLGL